MIPHVTQFDDADITDLEALRVRLNQENEKAGVKITMLAFLIKASVAALKKFPDFNASLDGDNLILKQYFHIGFAADTPNGLVVPVLKNADQKGVLQIAKEMGELSAKAREGKLGPADMQGGCFTISSLGGIGGTAFTPIINAPEVAILGVSKSAQRPVWNGRAFVPRLIVPLSLSYDHRVIDGASAARFTAYLARCSPTCGDRSCRVVIPLGAPVPFFGARPGFRCAQHRADECERPTLAQQARMGPSSRAGSTMTQDEQKRAVAHMAIRYVVDDAFIGVGTGSTADYFIDELARIKHRIKGAVASSVKSAERLKGHGIYVEELNNVGDLPVYIDGADEVTEHGAMIKGGGGALTREKIVAAAARKFVCIVDHSKLVPVLGKFPLPVEVIPMARSYVGRAVAAARAAGRDGGWDSPPTTATSSSTSTACRSSSRPRWKRGSAASPAWSPSACSRSAAPT